MFTAPKCVTCHASHVTCHVSHVTFFFLDKVVKLIGGGSVSTGPTPSSFYGLRLALLWLELPLLLIFLYLPLLTYLIWFALEVSARLSIPSSDSLFVSTFPLNTYRWSSGFFTLFLLPTDWLKYDLEPWGHSHICVFLGPLNLHIILIFVAWFCPTSLFSPFPSAAKQKIRPRNIKIRLLSDPISTKSQTKSGPKLAIMVVKSDLFQN